MSFQDVHASRAVGGAAAGVSGVEEDAFAATARSVASSVFQLTTNVTSFKRLVDAMVRCVQRKAAQRVVRCGNPRPAPLQCPRAEAAQCRLCA